MENLKLVKFDLTTDLEDVKLWKTKFNRYEFDSIAKYILEGDIFVGLDELIYVNYEHYPIDEDERKHCFAIKNENNDVLGFIIAILCEINTPNPELIIQYIVIRPDCQHKGVGKFALNELVSNWNKYLEARPTMFFTRIEETNVPSLKLFSGFGCEFSPIESCGYLNASAHLNTLEKESE